MSKIKLIGSNSGYVEISSAADAGNLTLQLPTAGTALLSNAGNVFSGITTTGQLDINGSIDVSSTSVFNDDLTLTGASYNVIWDKSDNQLEFGDNAKLSFGSSSDLQLYHDGNHSRIVDSGTGNLILQTSKFNINNADGTKAFLHTSSTDGIELYWNNSIKLTTETSGVNITGVCTATSFSGSGENLTRTTQLSHRNLIINGAMQVAQRGTSSTTSGYGSVDRFTVNFTGVDEAPTQSQVDVASGTSPYVRGFRKALRVTNGNQTGGAGNLDFISIRYKLEAQDIANSGWRYMYNTSGDDFITLSFWVKSSVAQNFYGYLYSHDGTAQAYAFETGSLSANTWTKVTKTIPGNSNLTFDNNNDSGLDIYISQFWGIDRTDGGRTLNSWLQYNGAARTRDFTSTWYTTNDATFELTGVQLEVGEQATPFEHRSFNDELTRCQRYYYVIGDARDSGTTFQLFNCHAYSTVQFETTVHYPVMRVTPSLVQGTGTGYMSAMNASGTITFNSWIMYHPSPRVTLLYQNSNLSSNPSTGVSYRAQLANSNAYVHLEAEL